MYVILYYKIITSRIRKRGNNIGLVSLCVCVFVCLCALSHNYNFDIWLGGSLNLTLIEGQAHRSKVKVKHEIVILCLILENDRGQVEVKVKCQGHRSRSPRSKTIPEKLVHQGHHKEVRGQGYKGQEESRSKLLSGVFSLIDLREVSRLFHYTLAIITYITHICIYKIYIPGSQKLN